MGKCQVHHKYVKNTGNSSYKDHALCVYCETTDRRGPLFSNCRRKLGIKSCNGLNIQENKNVESYGAEQ